MKGELEVEEGPSPELRQLVAALINETITPPQWKQLETILLDDEAARRYYISEIDLVASIEFALRMKRDSTGSMAPLCTAVHAITSTTCSGLSHK